MLSAPSVHQMSFADGSTIFTFSPCDYSDAEIIQHPRWKSRTFSKVFPLSKEKLLEIWNILISNSFTNSWQDYLNYLEYLKSLVILKNILIRYKRLSKSRPKIFLDKRRRYGTMIRKGDLREERFHNLWYRCINKIDRNLFCQVLFRAKIERFFAGSLD